MSILYLKRFSDKISTVGCISVPEDCIFLAKSADPDKMLPYAAFHLGLHCLPKYLFINILSEKG